MCEHLLLSYEVECVRYIKVCPGWVGCSIRAWGLFFHPELEIWVFSKAVLSQQEGLREEGGREPAQETLSFMPLLIKFAYEKEKWCTFPLISFAGCLVRRAQTFFCKDGRAPDQMLMAHSSNYPGWQLEKWNVLQQCKLNTRRRVF